jgi:DNA-binding NarL/FixJ family response regulator
VNLQPTLREIEVLRLVALGYCSKEIGHKLHISYKTVDKHKEHLMCKLNKRGIADLTRYAIHHNYIKASD